MQQGMIPLARDSQSHLYYIEQIADLDKFHQQISFCADRINSVPLVGQIIIPRKSSIVYIAIAGGGALLIAVLIIAFVINLIRKRIVSNRNRRRFIRQVLHNEQHEFGNIFKQWQVEKANVQIDFTHLIGKGSQSNVYHGARDLSIHISVF